MDAQQISKWGNSAGVRIPKHLLTAAHLKLEDMVQLRVEDGRIIIESAPDSPPTLQALLSRITPDNQHEDVNTGSPQGAEQW